MHLFSACFRPDADLDWDRFSQSSASSSSSSDDEREGGGVKKERIKDIMKDLFGSAKPLTRAATKLRLKKLVAVINKREMLGKSSTGKVKRKHALVDLEFKILVKIYAESEATAELNHIAKNQMTLSHLAPFLLNSILYGFKSADLSSSARSSLKSSMLQIILPTTYAPQPSPLTLNSTELLVKAQPEKQLEQWVFQQAYRSILFALQCVWYFTSSLQLGPPRSYQRTISLLLSVQSVLSSDAPPPEILQKENGERNEESNVAAIRSWLQLREERKKTFEDELSFVRCLTDISFGLFEIPAESRKEALRTELTTLNERIPENVFLPTVVKPHRVLRVIPEEAHVFNTRERAPYLLLVEIEEVGKELQKGKDEGRRRSFHTRRSSAFSDFGPPSKAIPRGGAMDEISSAIAPTGSPSASPMINRARRMHHEPIPPLELQKQARPHTEVQQQPQLLPRILEEAGSTASAFLERKESSVLDFVMDGDRSPPDAELIEALGEPFKKKSERLRKASPYGSRPEWRLVSVIVKARDQLRQEMFAQRLIQEFSRIWKRAGLDLWLKPYQILATGSDCGFIETVTDSRSIDSLKSDTPGISTLQDFFVKRFGGKGSTSYKRAVKNFVKSMAGYSVVSYLLNIKDRHNGNLLIDSEGHIIHIDFGFLLSNSPGGNIEFERAPFKLTKEMIEVMGGKKSRAWTLFKKLCIQGYIEACRHAKKIMLMVDIAYPGNERMPCFLQGRGFVLENMRQRFGLDLSKKERANKMARLIRQAQSNLTTKLYDRYQKMSLGIAS